MSVSGIRTQAVVVGEAPRSRRLRIAIATPDALRNSGQGRVNLEIATRLAEKGHFVTFVGPRVDASVESRQDLAVISWNLRWIPTNVFRSQINLVLTCLWLRRHRLAFDVVHGNGGFSLAESDVNTVHFVHAAWMRSPVHTSKMRSGLAKIYHRTLTRLNMFQERVAFQRARAIVAVSNRVRDEIVATGIDRKTVSVIHNGVDVEEFRPGTAIRVELGLPVGKVLALFAGDMTTPRKNLDSILRALIKVPDLHLAVVGSLRKNPYPLLAGELGIQDRVHFLDFRRDVAAIMRSVDLFVFPSRYEACSLVILEALASGLPVVTSVTAGGAEVVAEAGGIVIEDPNRVDLLEAALSQLVADDELRGRLGTSARETALRYSWSVMADKYEALYREQVGSR